MLSRIRRVDPGTLLRRSVPGRGLRPRTLLALVVVVAAAWGGGLVALWSWSQDRRLESAGTIGLSVEPFHRGSLDLYVPVVDWGVRFGGVRVPARLHLDVRTIDRRTAAQVAGGGELPLKRVRAEAEHAIAAYLRWLALVVFLASTATGAVVAVALRRARLALAAPAVGLAWVAGIALLIAPREPLGRPEYYARGADIPVALRAVESASRSADRLSEEVDAQLVGLARIVRAPARRPSLRGLPRVTIASDLHNNIVALPTLARAAAGGPVFFPGDLTDGGTLLEASVTRRVVRTGRPFVFTTGNHDSDRLARRLARSGAIVLDQTGRLLPDGDRGPVVARVAGLRVAGYASPNERLEVEHYRDRGADVTPQEQDAFLAWLQPLLGRVDVVLVHEPDLIRTALEALRAHPPPSPLLFAVGHTHRPSVETMGEVSVVNGGTVGAGGTGNLAEGAPLGLAVVTFSRGPFQPLAADLIRVAPGSGAATASRVPLGDTAASAEADAGRTTATTRGP